MDDTSGRVDIDVPAPEGCPRGACRTGDRDTRGYAAETGDDAGDRTGKSGRRSRRPAAK